MILMGECRSRLGNYEGGLDDELRLLKNKKLSSKERVAAQLRLSEKKILSNTMTALRNRLAPIRGIPTKGGGLKDPNADINEMFDMVEQVASAPAKFLTKFLKR
jgi:histone-lysine N-methyltransferase SETD3